MTILLVTAETGPAKKGTSQKKLIGAGIIALAVVAAAALSSIGGGDTISSEDSAESNDAPTIAQQIPRQKLEPTDITITNAPELLRVDQAIPSPVLTYTSVFPQVDDPEAYDAATVTVTWESSDPEVIEILQNGQYTVKQAGEATITATYDDIIADATILVTDLRDIRLKDEEIDLYYPGERIDIDYSLVPDAAINPKLIFESSDPDVVQVSPAGRLTPMGEGEAEIYITCCDIEKVVFVHVWEEGNIGPTIRLDE